MAIFKLFLLNLNKIVERIYATGYLPMPREIKQRVNAVCGQEGYDKFIESRNDLPEMFTFEEGYQAVYLIYDEMSLTVNSPLECAVYVHGGWSPPIYDPINASLVYLDPVTTYPLIVLFLFILSGLTALKRKKREN